MATDTSTGTEVSHEEMLRLNKAIHSGSFLSRLTTGTGAFDIIGRRRYYYLFSTIPGGRLDPDDRVPRLQPRHRLRRRHHTDFRAFAQGPRTSATRVSPR